ncbi:MAG: anthranilate synthase component I family protein [Taibaiella sp.]|nr:anthranilate synthase component I family protein [Taibaiella sp.]
MLNWIKQFSIFLFMDSNEHTSAYGRYECLLGAGYPDNTSVTTLDEVYQSHLTHKDWLFGHIGYDYKQCIDRKATKNHVSGNQWPALHFFCPKIVCYIPPDKCTLVIESIGDLPDDIYDAILNTDIILSELQPTVIFQYDVDKPEYLSVVEKLRQHIADGDCYEINYCTERYAHNVKISPHQVFSALNRLSSAPFAAYYRCDTNYMMCASPERYLQKSGDKLISQPIKGTARRDNDIQKDQEIKEALQNSTKEMAENVMITDLVRNDLARSCKVGSIVVEELFGIYAFPQVYQMISTVSGIMEENIPFTDAIRYSFPMGSMTGAPKAKVMQLIDEYEMSARSLFSGAVGYINPNGDFDLNVVIRSLFYDEETGHLSYQTGGAITYDSIAGQEWEEMRLKAWALERVFNG